MTHFKSIISCALVFLFFSSPIVAAASDQKAFEKELIELSNEDEKFGASATCDNRKCDEFREKFANFWKKNTYPSGYKITDWTCTMSREKWSPVPTGSVFFIKCSSLRQVTIAKQKMWMPLGTIRVNLDQASAGKLSAVYPNDVLSVSGIVKKMSVKDRTEYDLEIDGSFKVTKKGS